MSHPILVTGGTGTLGRHIVQRLVAGGHPVRVLTREPRDAVEGVEFVTGDLEQGTGIAAAVAGVATVVHCAGSGTGDALKAQTLVAAATAAAVSHVVYISVVGADRIPVVTGNDRRMFGYFEQKRAAEIAIEQSGIPFTILRATQFHDLVLIVAKAMTKLWVIPFPRLRAQPVAAEEVADRMVELALGAPAGLVPDLGGPEVLDGRELLRDYARRTGRRRAILPIGLLGGAAKAMIGGANLTLEPGTGRGTWREFVEPLLPSRRR